MNIAHDNGVNFADGTKLYFSDGRLDGWYVKRYENGKTKGAWDPDTFGRIKKIADKFGSDRVYKDFCAICDITTDKLDKGVFGMIERIAESYGKSSIEVNKEFSTLYMEMVAEENRPHHKIGKLIKRLALHKVFFEGLSVRNCVNAFRGVAWRELNGMCFDRGFGKIV